MLSSRTTTSLSETIIVSKNLFIEILNNEWREIIWSRPGDIDTNPECQDTKKHFDEGFVLRFHLTLSVLVRTADSQASDKEKD